MPLTDGLSSVDFGTVTAGGSGAPLTFTITNPGNADLTGLAVTKHGANAADFTVSGLSGTTVPATGGSVIFTVTFTPGASGVKNAEIRIESNVTGAKNPFDIALSGTAQSQFSVWASSFGVANNPQAIGANGLANLMNFAFGVNPFTGGGGGLVFNGTFGAGGTIGATGQPVIMMEPAIGGVDFRVLYVRRKNFVSAGLVYTLESGPVLGVWEASTVAPVVLADDGTFQIVSVSDPALAAGEPDRFFRVRVTLAP